MSRRIAPTTIATYTARDYALRFGQPALYEKRLVDNYIRLYAGYMQPLLLSKLRLVWSGANVLERVQCPTGETCRLSVKWEASKWTTTPSLLPLEKDKLLIAWDARSTHVEYHFAGPSTRALVANTAFHNFEISYTDGTTELCPKGRVYTWKETRSISTASRHFGSISAYTYPQSE